MAKNFNKSALLAVAGTIAIAGSIAIGINNLITGRKRPKSYYHKCNGIVIVSPEKKKCPLCGEEFILK